jgi:CheY-like chemotaxis protein/LmbE family N-acetylglucosaminyl deacetylase
MRRLKTNILLIEDDSFHATLMARWLESEPEYKVKHISNGFAAIDLALASEWDLVISDIELPDINGLELCRQIKNEQPMTPVLLTTAHEGVEYPRRALDNKVDEFLLKPFGKTTLLEKVAKLLKDSKIEKTRNQVRVLAIGAHPDMIEVGCGGSLLQHKAAGDRICILTMTNGAVDAASKGYNKEITDVASNLKSKLIIGDFQNGEIPNGAKAVVLIAKAINNFNPTVIYTHSANDSNQDRRNVSLSTIAAAPSVPLIYCYQSPTTTVDFQPSFFNDISSFLAEKIKLVSHYKPQPNKDYLNEDLIRSTARYWGRFCNSKEIEPLEVVKNLCL